jgi:hypothetical protein
MNRSRKLKNLEPGDTIRFRLTNGRYVLSRKDTGWATGAELTAIVESVQFAADKHGSMVVLNTDRGQLWGELETSIRLIGTSS